MRRCWLVQESPAGKAYGELDFRVHADRRPLAYSVVADLIHHVRHELNLPQLGRVVQVFSCNLNDASFSGSIQTMCAKLLNTIIESIHKQDDRVEAARIMRGMYITSLEKLEAFIDAYDRLKSVGQRDKGKGKAKEVEADGDVAMLEANAAAEDTLDRKVNGSMPIYAVAYAEESAEAYCRGQSGLSM
jgi:transformation/transcription domain-associated protein